MREQDARGGSRLVTGILIDDGIDGAMEQKTPRMLRQFMRDPDDVAGAAGGLQGCGDTAVAGAGAINTEQVGGAFQQRRYQLARTIVVVAPLQRGQDLEIEVFAR